MPFTLAHPIVIVPLRRFRWLPFSALVIGSMTPDFSHIVLFSWREYHLAHSWRGMVTLDLPIGIATFLLFHAFLKRPLLSLLPSHDANALYAIAATRWRFEVGTCLGVVAALLIGAFSHIALDSLTHGSGWTVRHCAALVTPVPLIGLPVFKTLQYGISVFGVIVLVALYRRWRGYQPVAAVPARDCLQPIPPRLTQYRVVAIYLACALSVSIVFAIGNRRGIRPHLAPRRVASDIICGVMAWSCAGAVAYASAWNFQHARLRRGPSSHT